MSHALIALRKALHKKPEVAFEESGTAQAVKAFIHQFNPSGWVEGLGGTGCMAIFEGKKPGKTIAFRAELDALPIEEINTFNHASLDKGKGHLCGHDGHMTMVAALSQYLYEFPLTCGRVILLFQPAEEIGEGASAMLADPRLTNLTIDHIFALHNLPGYPLGSVVIKQGIFSSASRGLIISLKGKSSHAAEPEKGISPAAAIAGLIPFIQNLPEQVNGFFLSTLVHVRVGERNFGISPGNGEMGVTLRATEDDVLKEGTLLLREEAVKMAEKFQLNIAFEEQEVFASTHNDASCVGSIEAAAKALGLHVIHMDQAFKWSEDFGLFSQKYTGAMFGLGAGTECPALHNPDYDFPDQLIAKGVEVYKKLIEHYLSN